MFKKINISGLYLNLNELLGPISKDFGSYRPFVEFEINNYNYMLNEVSKHLKFLIEPSECNITRISTPGSEAHKDHWPVVLNYYFNPNSDTTYWWKQIKNCIEDNPEGATNYNFSNLEKIDSFVAKKHDMYLLNTKEIHSVHVRKNSEPRYILKFAWHNRTFDEILNSIIPL